MCRNHHNLFLGPETACPDASKFETFILLVRFVFELELYTPLIVQKGTSQNVPFCKNWYFYSKKVFHVW